jgi:hypothetical protein
MGAHIAQIGWQTSTAGVEPMDSTLKPLKAALEAIRDMASNALTQIDQARETRSMRWKCKECRYTTHFTRPVSLDAAGDAPDAKVRRLAITFSVFYRRGGETRFRRLSKN